MASLCHPWFTTTNLSYRFPIFETSATALCGTTGIYIYIYIYMHIDYSIYNVLLFEWYIYIYHCIYIYIYTLHIRTYINISMCIYIYIIIYIIYIIVLYYIILYYVYISFKADNISMWSVHVFVDVFWMFPRWGVKRSLFRPTIGMLRSLGRLLCRLVAAL